MVQVDLITGFLGAGKTTFLRVLLGELPAEGKIKFGPSVKSGYLPQVIHFAHPERTLYDTMLYEKNCTPQTARDRLGAFLFSGEDVFKTVGTLSGGNQQKIVVARELDRGCRMLIAAQPTRGVDIASADYIQGRILAAAEQGCAVLLISSDLDELIKVSDRIMVLFRGQIMGFVDADNATREALGRMMLGEAH